MAVNTTLKVNETALGYINYGIDPDNNALKIHMTENYSGQTTQGRTTGVGRALVENVEATAKSLNLKKIELITASANARSFWERMGYKPGNTGLTKDI